MMDGLPLAAGLATGGAVTLLAVHMQGLFGSPRDRVRERVVRRAEPPVGGMESVLRRGRRTLFPLSGRLPLSPAARLRMEAELRRAGVPMRVGEYLAARIGCAALSVPIGLLLAARLGIEGLALYALVGGLFFGGWFAPRFQVSRMRKRRLEAMERQVPDALDTLARSLRAGTGVVQALMYTAEETDAPLGPELAFTVRELRLGVNPEEAFSALSQRVGSADLDIAVTAIVIQRSVGGNLAEILTGVSHTIRERSKLYGEIKVLTSRQKLTGNLVALVPVLIALAFILLNPDMGNLLVNTTAGRISLAVGLLFEAIGLVLIRKFAAIEV